MESELDEILSTCLSKDTPIKCIDYNGLFVPDCYLQIADAVENFEVQDDDIWVCSFPKTGTTWTQEMVWTIENDLDFEKAKTPLPLRFPFLEFTGTTTTGWVSLNKPQIQIPEHLAKSVEYTAKLPSPRFIKTHLPFHLLPRQLRTGEKKNKIIYVARNPKDTCISYYYHYTWLEAYCSTFDDFCKLFLGDKVYFAPFWNHVIEFWEKREERNILFLRYEDMKNDLASVIKKTAKYLEKSLNDYQVKELEQHLSFASMKGNPAINMEVAKDFINKNKLFGNDFIAKGEFIREGTSRQWETSMTNEIIKEFDDWTTVKLKDHPTLRDEFL